MKGNYGLYENKHPSSIPSLRVEALHDLSFLEGLNKSGCDYQGFQGSGKSTLIRLLSGLEKPELLGKLYVNDHSVDENIVKNRFCFSTSQLISPFNQEK